MMCLYSHSVLLAIVSFIVMKWNTFPCSRSSPSRPQNQSVTSTAPDINHTSNISSFIATEKFSQPLNVKFSSSTWNFPRSFFLFAVLENVSHWIWIYALSLQRGSYSLFMMAFVFAVLLLLQAFNEIFALTWQIECSSLTFYWNFQFVFKLI